MHMWCMCKHCSWGHQAFYSMQQQIWVTHFLNGDSVHSGFGTYSAEEAAFVEVSCWGHSFYLSKSTSSPCIQFSYCSTSQQHLTQLITLPFLKYFLHLTSKKATASSSPHIFTNRLVFADSLLVERAWNSVLSLFSSYTPSFGYLFQPYSTICHL